MDAIAKPEIDGVCAVLSKECESDRSKSQSPADGSKPSDDTWRKLRREGTPTSRWLAEEIGHWNTETKIR